MKPSHRKDVIIARIIFAVFCFVVIAMISGLIVFLVNKFSVDTTPNTQTTESQQDIDQLPAVDPSSQFIETEDIYVKTTSSVNMRAEANKEATVLTVLAKDTQLQLISETDGWAEVIYEDKTGYVSTDYIVEIGVDNTESTQVE